MTVEQTGKTSTNIKFGTDGWRALTTEDFTDVNVDLVARAICSHVIKQGGRGRGLVVGYDTRAGSRRFAEICAARAIEHGISVFMPERPIPTPVTAFAITHHETAGGFMITASHNPPDYNGIKFISPMGGPSGPEVTQAIEFEIEDLRERDGICAPSALNKDSELLQRLTILPAYKKQLAELVDFEAIRKAAPRVAVDPMHGAGYGILSDLLTEIGCEVLALRDTADSSFGGSMPDPSPELLNSLNQTVVGRECLVGLALDGDADRFGVIDSTGSALVPNEVIAVLADHLLARGTRGSVVRTVATSHLVDEIAESFGVPCIETPVGFKWIAAEMIERDIVIGGEESGGLSILGHIPEKDGILADLLLLELAIECGGRLRDKHDALLDRFGHYQGKRFDLHLSQEKKAEVLSSLKSNPPSELGGFEVKAVSDIDGVKLSLAGGGWVLFRPSGTEPLVRVYVEAKTPESFESISKAALAICEA